MAVVGREPWSNPQGSLFFSRVGGDSTTSAKGSSLRADRWRQSPYTRSATAVGALAIPSPRRGSFLERLSCEQINTGPVARVLDTASGWVLAAGTQGANTQLLKAAFQRRLWAGNDALAL